MATSKAKLKAISSKTARDKSIVELFVEDEKKRSSEALPTISASVELKAITADQLKSLMEVSDIDQLEALLLDVLSLKDLSYNLRDGIILDYYVAAIWWSKSQNYSLEQMLAFYTIIQTLIKNTEMRMSVTDNMNQLSCLISGLDVSSQTHTSGGVMQHFDVHQASNVASYLYTSLFQHYKLYLLSVGEYQHGHIEGLNLVVETPPQPLCPPPLCEAIPELIYNDRVLERPAVGQKTVSEVLEETIVDIDVLSRVTPEEVKRIMDEVLTEMLVGLSTDVAEKMRMKEAEFLERINRLLVSRA